MSNQESEYVKLISSDGFEFIVHREAAIRSGTIKNMLSGPGMFFGYGVVRHVFVTVTSSI
jgi:transcription elongation factor B subunit 1